MSAVAVPPRPGHRAVVAVPGAIVTTWLVGVTALGLWDRVADGLGAAVTMVFGSLVAGATPQGGGAVAFPVFTKVFEVPAAAARTYALCIQTVGMGTAAVVIILQRRTVAWRAVRIVGPAAAASFLATLAWLSADGVFRPSVVPDHVVKVGFTVVIAAMAVLMQRLRGRRLTEVDAGGVPGSVPILLAAGVLGGFLSALLGSGADVVAFLALTLLFGVRPGVAVPTSVVIMAGISALGFALLGVLDGQLLTAAAGVDLGPLWLAAVPVVAVGAPVGSWLAARASDRLLLRVVVALAVAEVVSTVVFLDRLRMDVVLSTGSVVVGTLLVEGLWSAHVRRRPLPVAAVSTPVDGGAGASVTVAAPSASATSRVPTPPAEIAGVRSAAGHVNHPAARYCHRSGQRLVTQPVQPAVGARPPLGVLCADDGTTVVLTDDLVIGRSPGRHHLVASGSATGLRLSGEDGSLSRAHLLVTLRGWDIRVADIGSRNGTWIQPPGGPWERLAVGEAVDVASGGVVACGERLLRFDHLQVR